MLKNINILLLLKNIKLQVGSTIAEIIAENNMVTKIIRLGLNDEFTSVVGNQEYLREVYNIDYKNILNKIINNRRIR